MKVLTVISDPSNFWLINGLETSAALFDLELIVLTINKKSYRSHRYKDVVLYNYLREVNDNEVIFFTDGYDALFLSDESEILEKFYAKKKKLLFSAEMNCWPDRDLSEKYPKVDSPYKFLCSGGFIGEVGFIKRNIENKIQTDLSKKYPFSNQIFWTERFLQNKAEIGLDTNCDIFATCSSRLDLEFIEKPKNDRSLGKYLVEKVKWFNRNFEFKDNRIYNLTTKTNPCHLHMNGFSKMIAPQIARQLFLL